MSTDINKIDDFHVVHVPTGGISSRMEKKGWKSYCQILNENYCKLISLQISKKELFRKFASI